MPEPPQLPPFWHQGAAVLLQVSSSFLSGCLSSSPSISKADSPEEADFGHDPELLTLDGCWNIERPINGEPLISFFYYSSEAPVRRGAILVFNLFSKLTVSCFFFSLFALKTEVTVKG